MNHDYSCIRSRIPTEPLWFDEHAVPRYDPFKPEEVANIYAREVAFVLIECQSCKREFHVAISGTLGELTPEVTSGDLQYGDPPNVDCCASGLSMSSIARRVLEFWRKNPYYGDWFRVTELEVEFEPWGE